MGIITWFQESVLSNTLMMVFLIAVIGYLVGSIKICGLELGTAGILLVALVFGHFGVEIPSLVRELGLICFVTSVGFIAGPKFFRNFKNNATSYILLGILVIGAGALTCVAAVSYTHLDVYKRQACVERCPRDVKPAKLIEAVRQMVVRQRGGNYLSPNEIPELLDEELPQQLLASAFRKYSK